MSPPCVVSVADHAGWAHLLIVAAPGDRPAVVTRRRVPLIEPGVPTMPYHHECLSMGDQEADALIAEVRGSVTRCVERMFAEVLQELRGTYDPFAVAIRPPTFPAMPASMSEVRRSYQLQCAADGMLYQFAVCDGARKRGLQVHECRRGSEMELAAQRVGLSKEDVETFVSRTGRPSGPPWADEHRRAFAAAIAVLATRVDRLKLTQEP